MPPRRGAASPPPQAGEGWGGGWRTAGDTVERLEEHLALRLVSRQGSSPPRRSGMLTARRARLDRAGAAARRSLACGRGRKSLASLPRSTAGPCPPGQAGRRAAAGPRSCRPGAISIRSIPVRCRPRRPGSSAGIRPVCWSSATPRSTAHLSGAPRAIGLGHGQYAHRWRRHCPGAGPHWRAPGLGRRERPGHRVRDPASLGARPAAGRCHPAHLRVLPRRLPRPHRSVRQRGSRRRRA